jgi:hypothetical protein
MMTLQRQNKITLPTLGWFDYFSSTDSITQYLSRSIDFSPSMFFSKKNSKLPIFHIISSTSKSLFFSKFRVISNTIGITLTFTFISFFFINFTPFGCFYNICFPVLSIILLSILPLFNWVFIWHIYLRVYDVIKKLNMAGTRLSRENYNGWKPTRRSK